MRLHRLRLKDFRGVADREVVFPDTGVVVLEGANEVGKTSMVEALDLLLTEKDSSAKRAVRSVQPVGSDVGSEVEAEISTGPYRFVLRKRWHVRPRTELLVTAPVRAQLTGVPAHERVRAMLAETVDDDLWRALRLMQAGPLTQTPMGGSTALASALDRAAGSAVGAAAVGSDEAVAPGATDDGEGASLVEAVEAELARYFTPTGRPTGDHARVVAAADAARSEAVAAVEALAEVARDVERAETLATEVAALTESRAGARRDVTELEVRWARVERLEADLQRRQAEAAAGRVALAAAERAVGARAERVRALDERRVALAARHEAATTAGAALTEHACALDGLAEQLAQAVAAETDAATEVAVRRTDVDLVADADGLDRLAEVADAVDAATAHVARCRRAAATATLDRAGLDRVEAAATARAESSARRDAAAARLRVEVLGDVEVRVGSSSPGGPGSRHLGSGQTDDRHVTAGVEVEVPGVVRVSVQPGADAADLETALRLDEDALAAALAAAGEPDLPAARDAHRRHLDATRELATAQEALRRLGATPSAAGVAALRAEHERALAARPVATPLPVDAAAARTAAARAQQAHLEARRRLDVARGEHERRRRLHDAVAVEVAAAAAALESLTAETGGWADELAADRAAAGDEQLTTAVDAAREALQVAVERETQAWSHLEGADRDALRQAVGQARAADERLAAQWDAARFAAAQVEGRLQVAGAQGRQDALDRALTRLEAAESDATAVRRRARAAALLRGTLHAHRDAARRRYVAPYSEQVTALGSVVFGPSFRVEVDDDLRITRRTLDGTTVDVEQLSTGAREQLAVITRLACAGLVDEVDGVPVVIDDALGWSDPQRLARVAEVLALAGRRSQVILLTCTPDRYAAIDTATVVPLTA